MIKIVNITNPVDPIGFNLYEVRINRDVVCTFRHRRSDGLGRCLLEAAKAVEAQKWDAMRKLMLEDLSARPE